MSSENSATSTVLLALLAGTLLGAGVALLYAPQSGRRMRQKLKDFGDDSDDSLHDLESRLEDGVAMAKRKGEEWMHQGEELIGTKKRQMAAALDAAKKAR